MTVIARLVALALATVALSTERGRGAIGSILITIGSELLPHDLPDPPRDQRIRERVMAELRSYANPYHGTNGHKPPPL